MNDRLEGEYVFVFVDEADGRNLALDNVPAKDS